MQPVEVPVLDDEMARWLAEGLPVVYANLGTVAHAPDEQLARMVEAFSASERRVLWVVRDRFRDRLPARIPPNVRVVSWVDSPRAVLAHPNVQAFVSHCGINSVYESIVAGTPVVGIPMLSDQRDMAVRIADAGVRLWVDKARLRRRNSQRRSRASAGNRHSAPGSCRSSRRAAAGGTRRAADLIEAQVRRDSRRRARNWR